MARASEQRAAENARVVHENVALLKEIQVLRKRLKALKQARPHGACVHI
jgi:hypothetical protein